MTTFSGASAGLLLTITSNNLLTPVDIFIMTVSLLATLVVGLSYGRQVKTLRDYALGDKNFATSTIVATIVATFSSGSGLFIGLSNTYTKGLYYIIASLGIPINLWLSGQLAIRMGEFMQHVSVAEAMGSMYGKAAQIITASSNVLSMVGYIAIQFKAISTMLEVLFQLDGVTATSIAAGIVILYSSLGGIKAVTFTDVVQFVTFGTVLPVLALVIWNNLQYPSQVMTTLAHHPLFDLKQVVGWHPKFLSSMGLLLYFAIPGISPELFQRIAMAKTPRQARISLTYSAGAFLLVKLITVWVGILLLTDMPGLAKEEVVPYMANHYTYLGLKGLLGAGIMALAMSTADSSLNAASVLFANDIVKPLTQKRHSSVMTARAFSVVMGFSALVLTLYSKDFLSLLLLSASLYMPTFTVPMLMAILGFRTTTKVVLRGMAAGFGTVILWSIFFNNEDSIIPGMLANLIVLLGNHYLSGEPGGWQKVAPDSPLGLERAARKEAWQRRKEAIKNFQLYPYLQQNLPQQEGIYSLFGFYTIIATYSALYAIEPADAKTYNTIYESIVHTGLFATTAFVTFPIWPPTVKSYRFMTFFWPLGMATLLFFAGTLIAIMSHFQPLQVLVLMINFLIAALLLHGPLALTIALSGVSLAILFFRQYTEESLPWDELGTSQFKALYGLLLFASLLIVLFRGKHAYAQLGKRNKALQTRDKGWQASLAEASAEKQAALTAFQYTGAEKLLTMARALQSIHVAEEDKERMQSLQTELLPVAFHLQGIGTKSQDYLRLKAAKLPLKSWCDRIKEAAVEQGVTLTIHCRHDTEAQEINCDQHHLTSLLVKSMVALSTKIEAQGLEDKPAILFMLEDTRLSYPLPDVKQGYIKYIPAVRIAITVNDDLPLVKDSYSAELNGSNQTIQDPTKLANSRIIKSHYGYAEVTDDTLIYVVPVDVEDVRPKDMDKDYMEVGAKPIRADDHFKNDQGIDAEAQEEAFLADVAKRSNADLGMVKMALETIKWYHGPKKRNSGEPFYLHPLTVAHIVLDYNQDEETIIGALLHDTVEDTPMQLEHIEAMFGQETAEVVDVVTHLQSIPGSIYKIKMSASENLQMLDRTASKRGLYVKIADRMHNMRTIKGHSKLSKRRLIAQETADFFVPLARKLGLKKTAQEFKEMCYEVFKEQE